MQSIQLYFKCVLGKEKVEDYCDAQLQKMSAILWTTLFLSHSLEVFNSSICSFLFSWSQCIVRKYLQEIDKNELKVCVYEIIEKENQVCSKNGSKRNLYLCSETCCKVFSSLTSINPWGSDSKHLHNMSFAMGAPIFFKMDKLLEKNYK